MSLLATLTAVPPLTPGELAALPADASRARENALRADLHRLRLERPGSGVCADAYNRLSRECAVMGRPLGALRENSRDEAERFFARTVEGPDGHVYWTGGKDFRPNNRASRRVPVRWWLERVGRKTDHYDVITAVCGDRACINPEHLEISRRSRQIYTEAQMLGALQVAAMRLGRPPSTSDWRRINGKPTDGSYVARFGSWENALHAAGFTGYRSTAFRVTREQAIAAIRYVRSLTGAWPSRDTYERHGDALQANGYPRSGTTVLSHFDGSWPKAVAAARNQD